MYQGAYGCSRIVKTTHIKSEATIYLSCIRMFLDISLGWQNYYFKSWYVSQIYKFAKMTLYTGKKIEQLLKHCASCMIYKLFVTEVFFH